MSASLEASVAAIESLQTQSVAIGAVCRTVVEALRAGNKILTAGNGGSAAESLHMAEEFVGRFRGNRVSLPAVALTADSTVLTCIGNDFGFDEIFSRQIEGLGKAGDVLVLFSTSGNAANLARALEAATACGVATVALLGRDGGALAGRADHEILVPGSATERIQEAHQVLLHLILDEVEHVFSGDSEC
ncbi:MAG: SIS domain-containing protein [Verrucomicrobia bacterium]|nr:SIS domain-containing protein [Verrucomicrobiota bacterium]